MERKLKDSGIPWIGQIPEHWETVPIKRITSYNDECWSENTLDEQVINYIEIADVNESSGITNTTEYKFCNAPSRARRITRKNDIIISTVRTYLKAITKIDEDGLTVSTGFLVLRAKRINPSFLAFSVKAESFIQTIISLSVGISYPAINAIDVVNLKIPVPPLAEQEEIAAYLDKKCGEIDELIEVEQQMISDRESYRQSVITEAVTHGLNPDAELKDSGIYWIGSIPERWTIAKMKFFVDISNGSDPKTEGDIPVFGSGATSFKTCGEFKEGPTVLIGRKGATLHIPHYIEGNYWNVDTAFDTKVKGYSLKYFFYIASILDYKAYISATTLPSMTQSNYENMQIPVPPLSEQQEIADYLDAKCAEIDELIKVKQEKIETLKQYRQSLIFEAVTGKTSI